MNQDLRQAMTGDLTESLLRMGIFGIGRFSSNVDVRALLQGSASNDLHCFSIIKICQLILVHRKTTK